MKRIDEVKGVVYRTLSGKYGDFGHQEEVARALDAAGHLMPDLPEPGFDNQGWAEWQTEYVIEVAFHPEDGLWSYDDGRMVRDTPDRLRKVALVYLAAADYAERKHE